MIIPTLISIVNFVARILTLVVIIDVVLSYFMPPYQPIRQWLDRIVEPMIRPIRRVVPPIGMVDLSPLVLLILIQVIATVLVQILIMI